MVPQWEASPPSGMRSISRVPTLLDRADDDVGDVFGQLHESRVLCGVRMTQPIGSDMQSNGTKTGLASSASHLAQLLPEEHLQDPVSGNPRLSLMPSAGFV